MKKLIILLFVMVYGLVLAGCSSKQEQSEPESLVGHIVIEDNILHVDKVEIITREDVGRIEELGLQQDSFPNGYHIYNPDTEKDTYELTGETVYNFVDVHRLFIKDGDGDRSYTTTKKEEFLQHLSTSYSDVPPAQKVPFFLEVKDGKVISVTEEFKFTI